MVATGSSQAATAASETEEEDDVVMRLPIAFHAASSSLKACVLQSPLRPRWRPYDLDEMRDAKIRPNQYHIEMGFEKVEAEEQPMSDVKLVSTAAAKSAGYAVGLLQVTGEGVDDTDDEGRVVPQSAVLHLTPLSACIQLRPCCDQPEEPRAAAGGPAAAADASVTEGAEAKGAAAGQIAPIFKRAETEKEVEARQKSHAYLMEQREAEAWRPLKMWPPDSAPSIAMSQQLFGAEGTE